MNHRRQARALTRAHLALTLIWASLSIPTVLWWRESILWVAFISLYANMVGHWSAFQSARTEGEVENGKENHK